MIIAASCSKRQYIPAAVHVAIIRFSSSGNG
jgi:hypothetical protein